MSYYCKHCGSPLKSGDMFCSKCGSQTKPNDFNYNQSNNIANLSIKNYWNLSIISSVLSMVLFFQPTMNIDVFLISGNISIYDLLFKMEYHCVYLIIFLLFAISIICMIIPFFTGKTLVYSNVLSMKSFSEFFCIFNIAVFVIAYIYAEKESHGFASCSVTPLGIVYLIANVVSSTISAKLATKLKNEPPM